MRVVNYYDRKLEQFNNAYYLSLGNIEDSQLDKLAKILKDDESFDIMIGASMSSGKPVKTVDILYKIYNDESEADFMRIYTNKLISSF